MNDEAFFFVRVGDLSRRPPITCPPSEDLVSVAEVMRRSRISGVVVADEGRPLGMITDRDFRNKIASAGGNITGCVASDIMTSPLITIGAQDYVFEAIYKMAQHNIHRLVVVDESGRLAGIVTATDVIALQTTAPIYLAAEIESAHALSDLKPLNRKLIGVVGHATRAGARTRDVVRLIAHLNDAITRRAIAILETTEDVSIPHGAAYLVLGSEGRREQTLRTDLDSAAVYAEGLSPTEVRAVERFCSRLVEALQEIGVSACPGGCMASNPAWRHSASEWTELIENWISVPTPEALVSFGMFHSLRTIHGDPRLEARLKDQIRKSASRNSVFLARVAGNILRFPAPIGPFGGLWTEKSGEHRGSIELKKAGIFGITEGISLLALEAGILDGTTWDKIDALGERHLASADLLAAADLSYTYLVELRLRFQLRALAEGRPLSNYVDPLRLSTKERRRLKAALRGVNSFLGALRDRYRLDFISP